MELEARLIDDLLDVARIAQGKLHLNRELVDVHVLVFKALETCRDAIQDGGFHLALDLSAAEHRVAGRPRAITTGLLEPDQERGEIHAPRRRDCDPIAQIQPGTAPGPIGGSLVVEVSDTGIGIEPDALAWIFQVLEQGDASLSRRFGGLGLGLAISQAVAEAHGGRLTAASLARTEEPPSP